jgi:hypothetical protein
MKKAITLFRAALIFTALLLTNISYSSGTLYTLLDFENPMFPPAGGSVTNTAGYNWVRTTACSGYGTGTACMVADFYDFQTGLLDFMTPQFPSSTANDSLLFDHAYVPATSENDRLDIYTSTNGGSTWVLLITLNGGAAGPLKTASSTQGLFIPTSGQWATKRYALPVGTNKVKFSGVTAYGNNLYMDNIKIGTPYTNDVGSSSVSDPKWGIGMGTVAPKGSVKNYGTTTQSFQVTMTITPGGYTNQMNVTNLAPGASQLLTFPNYNFSSNGTYVVKTTTTLGGDQNALNDTISSTVTVSPSPRNVVLELCTGTWCQWCPCGDKLAEMVGHNYPNSMVLEYHGAGADPWRVFNGSGIIGMLGFSGYPSGVVDREGGNLSWGRFYFDAELKMAQSPAASVNIDISSVTFNSSTRLLTVNANAIALQNLTGQYKVNYIITEDNLVYPQTGNSYCPGSSTWEHDWVVRNMVNGAAGENVNTGGTWNNAQSYPVNFTTTLEAGWLASNCKVNIFIYKEGSPLNASQVQQGKTYPITVVGINNQNNGVPVSYGLEQNYPNPFNPSTSIQFSIPKDGNTSLKIYDMTGREVAVYLDGFVKAGFYNADVDASAFATGVYFYTLTSGSFVETKKMVLVK